MQIRVGKYVFFKYQNRKKKSVTPIIFLYTLATHRLFYLQSFFTHLLIYILLYKSQTES